MDIKSIKQLDAVMKLARKHGVSTVKLQGIEFSIDYSVESAAEAKSRKAQYKPGDILTAEQFGEISADDKIDTPTQLSVEDLLFYSASGQPIPKDGGEA